MFLNQTEYVQYNIQVSILEPSSMGNNYVSGIDNATESTDYNSIIIIILIVTIIFCPHCDKHLPQKYLCLFIEMNSLI